MCGITGIVGWNDTLIDPGILGRMTDVLRHRGPDGQGVWSDGLAGLGHTRLAIIDLSDGGKQPMSTADGRYTITCNGAIYNYIELREELEQGDVQFVSQSDTEVVLNAYVQWGPDCVKRFNGMWAFAIWDKQEKQLFCSRDHFGIKPFYYYHDNECFVFASEIKALLKHPRVSASPNDRIIYDYLLFGLVDHNENTFFAGIRQLPAAHSLILKNGSPQISRWWDVDGAAVAMGEAEEKAQTVRRLLEESVRLRLRSDVPVASLLSGGLDSSTLVAMVSQIFGAGRGHHESYTAVYDEVGFNEDALAGETCEMTGVRPNLNLVKSEAVWDDIESLVYHQDSPFQSTSICAQWNLLKAVGGQGVKVVMDGQGADECLAGYDIYHASRMAGALMKGSFIDAHRSLKRGRWFGRPGLVKQLAMAAHTAAYRSSHMDTLYAGTGQVSSKVLSNAFRGRHRYASYWHHRYDDFLKDHLYQMMFYSNLPGLLRFEDRNAMAFGIESRLPFLDHRFVSFCLSLSPEDYIVDGWTKHPLRLAAKGMIPESVRLRKDKMGFPTPEQHWLTQEASRVLDIVESPRFAARGYFDVSSVKSAFKAYTEGKVFRKSPFWRIVNLELWFRQFFD